jgi:hypothetical protein
MIKQNDITVETFKAKRFHVIPKFPYAFYIHENLAKSDPNRIDACLLGIMEVLSGLTSNPHLEPPSPYRTTVEIPPDTGFAGICVADFDFVKHEVRLISIMTAREMTTFIMPP